MSRGAVWVFLWCALAARAWAADPWDAPTGPNLVRNPSFEALAEGEKPDASTGFAGRPADWTADPAVYTSVVTGTAARCLRYVNQDPARYVLCSQTLDLQPGCRYEFSAKVKTQGVVGNDSGATVCVEWYDAKGGYLGGSYPDGRKGDSDWTTISAVTSPLPAGAARASIACYLRKGMTGTAWWDDVSLRRWRERPLETALLAPAYRGLLAEGAREGTANRPEVRVRVRTRLTDLEGTLEKYRLAVRFGSAEEGGAVVERGRPVHNDTPAEVVLPLPALAAGPYQVRISLRDSQTRKLVCEDVYPVSIGKVRPKSYVDEHGRLILNGQPFFPLGMYWGGLNEDELAIYKEGPFNCLMPYGAPTREQLDVLDKLGLKAFYSIKDDYFGTEWCPASITSEAGEEPAVRATVRAFRDHPALLAWYINDERPSTMRNRLEAHQRWVEEEDPDHPTWAVLYQVDELTSYLRTCDILGADPYPIPGSPALVGRWARLARQAGGPARAVWMVPQAFRYPGRERPPTYDEMRSMTWQCLAEGATGLIYYSWFEMRGDTQLPFARRWPELKRVAAEVQGLVPVLLSVEKAPGIGVTGPEPLHWTVRAYQGVTYLILVNGERTPVTAKVHLPRAPRRAALAGKTVSVKKDFRTNLPPLGVSVYRLVF